MLSPDGLHWAAGHGLGWFSLNSGSAFHPQGLSPRVTPCCSLPISPCRQWMLVWARFWSISRILRATPRRYGEATGDQTRAQTNSGMGWRWLLGPLSNAGEGGGLTMAVAGSVGSGGALMANRFPSHRPRWFPTMTRTAPTLSPTCPRLPACTRYPPVDPSLSSPLHSHPCIWLNGPLSQLTPCPTPMHRPHLPPPHLALPLLEG